MNGHMESAVAASRDAHTSGSAVAASPTVAVPVGTTAVAASPVAPAATLPSTSLTQELSDVKQRITAVEKEITAVEVEIVAEKKARDDCPVGSEARQEHTAELQQLRKEKEQLRKKEEQLRDEFKRKELDRSGECTHENAGVCEIALFHFRSRCFICRLIGVCVCLCVLFRVIRVIRVIWVIRGRARRAAVCEP